MATCTTLAGIFTPSARPEADCSWLESDGGRFPRARSFFLSLFTNVVEWAFCEV